jgi:hypothetical protein
VIVAASLRAKHRGNHGVCTALPRHTPFRHGEAPPRVRRRYKQNLVPCPHCARTFNPDRIDVHLKSCKPGSGSKPVGTLSRTAASSANTDGPAFTTGQPCSPAAAAAAARPRLGSGTRAGGDGGGPAVSSWTVPQVSAFFSRLVRARVRHDARTRERRARRRSCREKSSGADRSAAAK